MPYTKKPYKMRRRRRRTTRRGRITRRNKISRYVAVGVPEHRYVKLKYTDVLSLTANAATTTTYIFQSSMYDPYYAAGGHQPLFFDQYAAMYNYYTVFGIAYNINILTDAQTNGPLIITVYASDSATTVNPLSSIRERKGCKETVVSHGYRGKMKGYVSVMKTLGVTRSQLLNESEYSAAVNANPGRAAYIHVSITNPSGASNIAVYLTCLMTYYGRFYQAYEVAQS